MPHSPPGELHLEDLSLADFIVRSYRQASAAPTKNALWQLASKLTDRPLRRGVHRFSFDEKVDRVLEKMQLIPIEDFIAHHDRIVLPFDEFWIEQTPPVYESARHNRFGVLLSKDPNSTLIKAKFAVEMETSPDNEDGTGTLVLDRFIRGEQLTYFVSATNIEIIFSSQGIHLNTRNATLKKAFLRETGASESDETYKEFSEGKLKAHIDRHIAFAHDIYRLLLLVSCHNVRSTLSEEGLLNPGSSSWNWAKASSRYRETDSPLPRIHTPIKVDLSRKAARALEEHDRDGLKALLGWTDVMGFLRHYHTREGIIEKAIAPHERRIATPIDRRGSPRVITSSDTGLDINLDVTRPRLIRRKPYGRKLGSGDQGG